MVDVEDGRLDEADGKIAAMSSDQDGRGRVDLQVALEAAKASLALARGDLRLADASVQRMTGLARQVDRSEIPRILRLSGHVAAVSGHADAAALLTTALDQAHAMDMVLEEARCLTLLGVSQGISTGPHFHRAREIFARCGSQRGLAQVRRAVATLAR
jgi:hypothetical protein